MNRGIEYGAIGAAGGIGYGGLELVLAEYSGHPAVRAAAAAGLSQV